MQWTEKPSKNVFLGSPEDDTTNRPSRPEPESSIQPNIAFMRRDVGLKIEIGSHTSSIDWLVTREAYNSSNWSSFPICSTVPCLFLLIGKQGFFIGNPAWWYREVDRNPRTRTYTMHRPSCSQWNHACISNMILFFQFSAQNIFTSNNQTIRLWLLFKASEKGVYPLRHKDIT